jgi:guanosine-3',5'-bis(diphosphate) 3'-pyrophosphohydrolase
MTNDLNTLLRAASFAAKKHTGQNRKGASREPYINHPLEVANLLANIGKVADYDVLIAALLHDTIEDVGVRKEELADLFGERVANYVAEVSDDKSLPKQTRKELQVEHAPHLSAGAKQIKLADKISNVTDIMHSPPEDWSRQRKIEYVEWGERVVVGLRGANAELEKYFDETAAQAKQKFQQESD